MTNTDININDIEQNNTNILVHQAIRTEQVINKLNEWLSDETGYDEKNWPIVEKLLEENPVTIGRLLNE